MPFRPIDQDLDRRLRAALREHYFNWDDPAFFASEAFAFDLNQHVRVRYEECAKHVVPWVHRCRSLVGARIAEIGCGTGSSTAAFAQALGPKGALAAYDINAPSLAAAEARLQIFGLGGVTFRHVAAEALTATMRSDHPAGVDIVLCYAVLEHQTLAERLDTISTAWDLLRPGGVLVVGDSPNRLCCVDYHSSGLAFFDPLPHDLAILYAHRSGRRAFAKDFPERPSPEGATGTARWPSPDAAALTKLARWGRGISYHDFEVVLGDLTELVVGDSLDPEILAAPHREVSFDDKLMFAAATWHAPHVPPAFLRAAIEVILRKPGASDDAPALRRAIPGVRIE